MTTLVSRIIAESMRVVSLFPVHAQDLHETVREEALRKCVEGMQGFHALLASVPEGACSDILRERITKNMITLHKRMIGVPSSPSLIALRASCRFFGDEEWRHVYDALKLWVGESATRSSCEAAALFIDVYIMPTLSVSCLCQTLDLRKKSLVTFPDIFQDTTRWEHIQELFLDDNAFCVLPKELFCLPQLHLLSCAQCVHLQEIPNLFWEIPFLRSLDLTGCVALERLPCSLSRLMMLQALIVDGCVRLSHFPCIRRGELPVLQRLQIASCFSLDERVMMFLTTIPATCSVYISSHEVWSVPLFFAKRIPTYTPCREPLSALTLAEYIYLYESKEKLL